MVIKVELLSDAHIGSGGGAFGGVDADVTYDGRGLPILPAKRVKGLLREAGLELVGVFDEYADTYYTLFGTSGSEAQGALRLSDGKLDGHDALTREIIADKHRAEDVSTLFTSLRTGTAMERGDGIIRRTDDNTLRVMRVVDKGAVFHLAADMPDSGDSERFLAMCCGAVKSMGSNRTRGLGEVKCELVTDAASSVKNDVAIEGAFTPYDVGGLKQASFVLTLKDSVVITPHSGRIGDCEDYIPGSAILGAYAKRWIDAHPGVAPHTDAEFKRLFLEGGVKFLSAYPMNEKNNVLYPAPKSIRTAKDGAEAIDTSVSDAPDDYAKTLKGFMGEGYGVLSAVAKTVNAHHARPHDKSIGHATENVYGQGAFYSYEAIADGLKFMGAFVGSEEDLTIIAALSQPELSFGKSRSAQYGRAAFAWHMSETLENETVTIEKGERIRVILRSAAILTDDSGTIAPTPTNLAMALGLRGFDPERVFCSYTEAGGYNAKWLLPRSRAHALAAGSVVVFVNNGDKLEIASEHFVGLRTGEGFGHVFVSALPKTASISLRGAKQGAVGAGLPTERRLKDKIALSQLRARVQAEVNDSVRHGRLTKINGSQLGRLRTSLSTSSDFAGFADKLRSDSWKQTKDREAAQKFCVGVSFKASDEGGLTAKLAAKAQEVLGADAWALLDDAGRYHWFRVWLNALIRAYAKQRVEGGHGDAE